MYVNITDSLHIILNKNVPFPHLLYISIIGAIGSCFPVNAGIYLIWQDNYNLDTTERVLAKTGFQRSWSNPSL